MRVKAYLKREKTSREKEKRIVSNSALDDNVYLHLEVKGEDQREFLLKDQRKSDMFIAALFTTARLWKQPRCPTNDEWIKKMWYMYTMEYYSAIKKNEIMLFAGKWMELENIM
jgi:hypothetical protein